MTHFEKHPGKFVVPKRVHGSVEMPSSDGEVSRRGSVLWSDKGTKIVQGSTADRCIQVQIYYYDESPAKCAQPFPLVVVPLRNEYTLLLFARRGVLISSTSSSVQVICLQKCHCCYLWTRDSLCLFWYLKSMIERHGAACPCLEQYLVTWILFGFTYSNASSSAMVISCNNLQ